MLFRALAANRRKRQSEAAKRLGKQARHRYRQYHRRRRRQDFAADRPGAGTQSAADFSPGVISRGYGVDPPRATLWTWLPVQDPATCGDDENRLLIAASADCPVVVDPDRPAALAHLLAEYDVDLVLSDDGPANTTGCIATSRLPWVDGARMFGKRPVPARPARLREPKKGDLRQVGPGRR